MADPGRMQDGTVNDRRSQHGRTGGTVRLRPILSVSEVIGSRPPMHTAGPKRSSGAELQFALVRLRSSDYFGVVLDRAWPAEQIALHLVACLARQERPLLLGFDAFGDHRQIEAVPQS